VQLIVFNGFFLDQFFGFLSKHRFHAPLETITQTYPHLYPPKL